MSSHDISYLKDMLQSAKQIRDVHLHGVDQPTFNSDLTVQRAVLFEITVIGEAVKQISKGFRKAHPEVPWKDLAGMRDRLIHGYRRIDLQEVWNTAINDIPTLITQLEPLIPPEQVPPEAED